MNKKFNRKQTHFDDDVDSVDQNLLHNIHHKLDNSPALNGGFDRLLYKIDGIEKSQVQIVEKVDKIYKELYSKKQQPHTDFKKQRYQAFLSTTLKDVSLEYIFSTIVCNPIIPFCSFKNICKIYKKSLFEFSKNSDSLIDYERIMLKIAVKEDIFVDSFIFLKDGIVKIEIHIDIEQKIVSTGVTTFRSEFIVLAIGSQNEYFGIAGLPEMAYGFKSVDDALKLRQHVERLFETHTKTETQNKNK